MGSSSSGRKRKSSSSSSSSGRRESRTPDLSNRVYTVRQGPNFKYAMSVMKHPDPVGMGLAEEAWVESAGKDCLVPGLKRPVRVLGMKVWPLEVKVGEALRPMGRELARMVQFLDAVLDLMQKPLSREGVEAALVRAVEQRGSASKRRSL